MTEQKLLPLLDGLDLGVARDRILVVDTHEYAEDATRYVDAAVPRRAASPPTRPRCSSSRPGTSGAPKAAIMSQGRSPARAQHVGHPGAELRSGRLHGDADVPFERALRRLVARVYVGATIALRRRFSASGFLPDVRRFGATYFNYVGKPLSYILATPPRPDDRDHTLVRVFGNEAGPYDVERFSERFGVPVVDNYGSTEGGVTVMRAPPTSRRVRSGPPRRRARRRSGDAVKPRAVRGSTTPAGCSTPTNASARS